MLHIDKVSWLGGHVLRLSFDNGDTKVVDVLPLLKGPVFTPLLDATLFSEVTIDPVARTIVWPNGVDLAPEALYALMPVETADRP
jgi:hypothetical protein